MISRPLFVLELTANKITPVEGFQNLERTIANSVVASISDDVRATVKKSLRKAN
jgi:hypothetical protein